MKSGKIINEDSEIKDISEIDVVMNTCIKIEHDRLCKKNIL